MDNNLLDQLEIDAKTLLCEKKHTLSASLLRAKFTEEQVPGKNATAILQINVAENGTSTEHLAASLKLINKEFTEVIILIDMELAKLIYSIIMPYMPKGQVQGIVERRKSDWITQSISSIINNLTIPWKITSSKDDKYKDVLKLVTLLKENTDLYKSIQEDAASLKSYLTTTHNIIPALYKDKDVIERYIISRMVTIYNYNHHKNVYITLNNMMSYKVLQKTTKQQSPQCLTIYFTKNSRDNNKEILTSTELNQKLHEFDMLDKISHQRSYLENSAKYFPGNVYLQSTNRTLLTCNKFQSASFGIADESYFEGKSFKSLFPKSEANKIANTVEEIISTNEAKVFVESNYYPLAGKEIFFVTTKMPLRNKKNRIIGVLGFSKKLGDKRALEKFKNVDTKNIMKTIVEGNTKPESKIDKQNTASLRKTIETMPGNVIWQDTDGKILGCNHCQAQFLNFSSPKDLVGKNLDGFLTKEHAKKSQEHIADIVSTGKPVITEEIYKTENGFIVMSSHKTPIKDQGGKIIGIMTVSFDISANRQREIKLEQEKEKLEQAHSCKNKFIQDIEHDMRTPFAGLCSLTELCAYSEKDSTKKKHLDKMSSLAKELMTRCDALLEANRNGDFSNNNTVIMMQDLATGITNNHITAIKEKFLDYDLDFDNNIPKEVLGDHYKVRKILNHLMHNATEHTKEGGIKLTIKLESNKQDSPILSFTVTDTGKGFSNKDQETMFDKGRVLSHTIAIPKQKIDLNEVKRFVEDLRGTISVDSEIGKGTSIKVTIGFTLPNKNNEVTIAKGTACHKVLIVEDSRITTKFLEGAVASIGSTSKTTTNGAEALNLFKNDDFDILLLDIDLEDTTGYKLVQEIRNLENTKQKPPIIIIMMTAQQSKIDMGLNKNLGIAKFLVKPISMQDISGIMQTLTKHKEM